MIFDLDFFFRNEKGAERTLLDEGWQRNEHGSRVSTCRVKSKDLYAIQYPLNKDYGVTQMLSK